MQLLALDCLLEIFVVAGCAEKGFEEVKILKKFQIFEMLMSNYSKHNMGITNINYIFQKVHPPARKSIEKKRKYVKIKACNCQDFNILSY